MKTKNAEEESLQNGVLYRFNRLETTKEYIFENATREEKLLEKSISVEGAVSSFLGTEKNAKFNKGREQF